MVPAIAPIPPHKFKAILEKHGYHIEEETELNWTLINLDAPNPVIILPKKGDLVSISVMMGTLARLGMDNKKYFSLLEQVSD